jgi:hypothetical protein
VVLQQPELFYRPVYRYRVGRRVLAGQKVRDLSVVDLDFSRFWRPCRIPKYLSGHEKEPGTVARKCQTVQIERRLLQFITRSNWILLSIVTVAGFIYQPGRFAGGVLAGGLIVTINFHLLYRSLKSSLTPPHVASVRVVLGKYYIRFLLSAVIIYVLIAEHMVDPLGLIIGLSVVVTSIIIATFNEIRKIIF